MRTGSDYYTPFLQYIVLFCGKDVFLVTFLFLLLSVVKIFLFTFLYLLTHHQRCAILSAPYLGSFILFSTQYVDNCRANVHSHPQLVRVSAFYLA